MPYYEDNPTAYNMNTFDWDKMSEVDDEWQNQSDGMPQDNNTQNQNWPFSRNARTFTHIAFKVDSMLAQNQVPVMILMSPRIYKRMTEYVLLQRKDETTRFKKTLLGMPMVKSESLDRAFKLLTREDAQWEGLL
jgi:hypothetical protein